MSLRWCERCGDLRSRLFGGGAAICPCREYRVFFVDYHGTGAEDDARELGWTIHARSAEEAAEEAADRFDVEGDYTIIQGDNAEVTVWEGDGEPSRFTVSGRTERVYSARRLG